MSRFTLVAAAALAAGGLVFLGCDREDRDAASQKVENAGEKAGNAVENAAEKSGDALENAAEKTADATKVAGSNIKDAVRAADTPGDATEEIHDVLASVAEAALTKDGIAQMVERFVDADRDRLGIDDGDKLDNGEVLDGRIDQFRKDWEAQYKQGFDIKDEAKVYQSNVFMIRQSELGKDAGGVEVDVERTADGKTEVEVDRKSGVDAPGSKAADTNLNDPGRNVATVTIKGKGHGLADLQVPMIHEAGGWKIDVPDTLTADKLRENLLTHLTAANEAKAKWPGNAPEGYAVVTHHVLMAVFDQPVK